MTTDATVAGVRPDDPSGLDRVLADLAARSDVDALAGLLERHGDLAWQLALHATGDAETAERVMGETWHHATRLASRRDRSIPVRWWLLRLVFLECERVARGVSTSFLLPDASPRSDELLSQALLALPVRRRAAWIMHELLDLRAADVAVVLTCSEWRAQALVADARNTLVALMVLHERRRSAGRGHHHDLDEAAPA